MNYKLAKQLKDAGFPQKGGGTRLERGEWYEDKPRLVQSEGELYYPSLEELIDACGDEFMALQLWDKGWMVSGGKKEIERCNDCEGQIIPSIVLKWFKTPSEAVAKLWLKLKST